MRMPLAAIAVTALLTAGAHAQGSGEFLTFNEVRKYHDHWLGACPADGHCRLVGGTLEAGDGFFWKHRVSIEVDPAKDAPVVTLFLGNDGGCRDAADLSLTFSDGTLVTTRSAEYQNICNTFALTDPAEARAVVAAMKAADSVKIVVGYDGFSSTQEAVVSLKGVTAGLAWIDQRQGQ